MPVLSKLNTSRLVGTSSAFATAVLVSEATNATSFPLPVGLRIVKIITSTLQGTLSGSIAHGAKHPLHCHPLPGRWIYPIGIGCQVFLCLASIGCEAAVLKTKGYSQDTVNSSMITTAISQVSSIAVSALASWALRCCSKTPSTPVDFSFQQL